MKPIILAGGNGTRLWPKSRTGFPKQFLSLASDSSMLQETLLRLSGLPTELPIIICNETHRFIVAEQLRDKELQHGGIILEPFGRNTAPAIALAAFHSLNQGEDPVMLVLPADHLVHDVPGFHGAVRKAEQLAQDNHLVTFGIVPTKAHSGYGYIKIGESVGEGFQVDEFVEKPDLSTAQGYLESGRFLWNSGMFMFKASHFLSELKKYSPDIYEVCSRAMEFKTEDLDFMRIDPEVFGTCPEDSVDYAIMERASSSVVVPLNAGWNDIGSWTSLWETAVDKDDNQNVAVGDVILEDVNNSYVNAEHRLVSVIGLDDVVVVETKDAVMVVHQDKVQKIKEVVGKLKAEKRPEAEFHRQIYRPWGNYDSIDSGGRFQVKRITVKPGEKLSVQMHHHRAEHWIVVSGTARVKIGEKTSLLTENQSTYIPVGEVHSLENPGWIDLELVEVQSGSYLGEEDIVRFSDIYGRSSGQEQVSD